MEAPVRAAAVKAAVAMGAEATVVVA